jgi:hypothetical protein
MALIIQTFENKTSWEILYCSVTGEFFVGKRSADFGCDSSAASSSSIASFLLCRIELQTQRLDFIRSVSVKPLNRDWLNLPQFEGARVWRMAIRKEETGELPELYGKCRYTKFSSSSSSSNSDKWASEGAQAILQISCLIMHTNWLKFWNFMNKKPVLSALG